jgi:hypothetical protein
LIPDEKEPVREGMAHNLEEDLVSSLEREDLQRDRQSAPALDRGQRAGEELREVPPSVLGRDRMPDAGKELVVDSKDREKGLGSKERMSPGITPTAWMTSTDSRRTPAASTFTSKMPLWPSSSLGRSSIATIMSLSQARDVILQLEQLSESRL